MNVCQKNQIYPSILTKQNQYFFISSEKNNKKITEVL